MQIQATLNTPRLVLRPLKLSDASRIQELAGVYEVARFMRMPHPYEDGMAEAWITMQQQHSLEGKEAHFAITLPETGELCGIIGLMLTPNDHREALGYWLGVPYWGNGYCTEAAQAVVDYGFEVLKLNRIEANHYSGNPASGRVMQKIGMQYEGTQRQYIFKWEQYFDSLLYGILRSEWLAFRESKEQSQT